MKTSARPVETHGRPGPLTSMVCYSFVFLFSVFHAKSATAINYLSELSDILYYSVFSCDTNDFLKKVQKTFPVSRETGLKFLIFFRKAYHKINCIWKTTENQAIKIMKMSEKKLLLSQMS